jgi:hypothetical protein
MLHTQLSKKEILYLHISMYYISAYTLGVRRHVAVSILYISFIVEMGWSTLWHLHRFLQCIKYVIHEFTSSILLLYLPLP